jgi:methylenetetrahydrofolate dehydrogenase (NADP+)/methenyltetrahydrofolate cyclohydrolase
MNAQIIDGKAIAKSLREELTNEVSKCTSKPGLAVILVGDNPASHVYVRNKIKATENCGMISIERRLPETASASEIENVINELNADNAVHGILLQLPLPASLKKDEDRLIQCISPEKDVDGLTLPNIGKLVAGIDGLVPCTPQGSLRLIKSVRENLSGLHAVVIGRSLLFGKPMAQLLLQENCTVTQAHSRTQDLPSTCKQADIIVAAVGRTKMVKADWVKDGAIVIDVGINRQEDGKLKGDVDFETVKEKASAITPVPGGVGPMTIACLLANTLKAYKLLNDV